MFPIRYPSDEFKGNHLCDTENLAWDSTYPVNPLIFLRSTPLGLVREGKHVCVHSGKIWFLHLPFNPFDIWYFYICECAEYIFAYTHEPAYMPTHTHHKGRKTKSKTWFEFFHHLESWSWSIFQWAVFHIKNKQKKKTMSHLSLAALSHSCWLCAVFHCMKPWSK